ncbi:MAG: hypothetical protein HW390_1998 [Candidatus Brocadiaceae bacterium]|nr:hypothetical protein [Candidatus Brocadiaceae bacterium]
MISEAVIKKAIDRLVDAAKPQKIYLFGSMMQFVQCVFL